MTWEDNTKIGFWIQLAQDKVQCQVVPMLMNLWVPWRMGIS